MAVRKPGSGHLCASGASTLLLGLGGLLALVLVGTGPARAEGQTPGTAGSAEAAHPAGSAAPAPSSSAGGTDPDPGRPPRDPCLEHHERGQVLRREGKLVAARQQLLECARVECSPAVRRDCIRWQEELDQSIPSLVFAATLDGRDYDEVRVRLGERVLAEHLDGRAVPLDPGVHELRFETGTGRTATRRLTVREGEKNRLVVVNFDSPRPAATAPPPRPEPPPAFHRPVPTLTYLLGGLALVAAGSSTYFGLSALQREREAEDECAPFCSDVRTDAVRTRALASDISTTVAITAAGAALYFYLTRPTVPEREAALGTSDGASWALPFGVEGSRRHLQVKGGIRF